MLGFGFQGVRPQVQGLRSLYPGGAEAQVLVQTLWACAKMRASGAALLTPIVAEVATRLPSPGAPADGGASVQQWQLSMTLWACGRLEHHPGWPELQRLTSAAEAGVPHMSLRDLARCGARFSCCAPQPRA